MAMKDWKKVRDEGFITVYNKGEKVVAIQDYSGSPSKYRWQVGYGTAEKYNGVDYKYFKTKSQALAYARSYMRKN